MAIIRKSELRNMSDEDLKKKLVDLKRELLKERAHKMTAGVPLNPGRMREIRRTIARILTILNERKKNLNTNQ
ncbi:50S ribosomal protein L29 [Methanocaldococcus infernus]|uniref:Large ribosomal subunit protein uL29 n=1 Tax=Methanocaldococcus infernus (strain DSM 11812 / JCM 15783 / ME) TaxID=573063 RepID=D5VRU6_METIM|nr:50S ribosomal protein L29 [Methanocaldococcus infernus]ADG13299.1 ribosomal protein L29 [Methanocaldococcus infernus ME]